MNYGDYKGSKFAQNGIKRLKNLVVENWLFKNTGNLFCPWISKNFKMAT